ncbi:MAG: RNA methyltransferase [Tissierellia bacterium]|nr:RNA methyltransferase [Tissierellia bacterium]
MAQGSNVISSTQNPRIKEVRKLRQKKYREKTGRLLLEGPVVLQELWPVIGPSVLELFVREDRLEEAAAFAEEWTTVTGEVLQALAESEHSQGMVAVVPSFLRPLEELPEGGRYLYTDGIQDPGNLGGMIRSAEAFSMDGLILGPGTVDVTSGKVLRSSMASAFRLPIYRGREDSLEGLRARGDFLLALDIQGRGELPPVEGGLILIVGNEARGVSEEARALADERYTIAMNPVVDSLNANVAASIAMFALQGNNER